MPTLYPSPKDSQNSYTLSFFGKVRVVRTLLLCRIRHHFCHLLVVAVDAFIVVIFVIVIVVVAMVAVMWAGARAREEQWQQQQQCGALGVRRGPPGMIEMILRTEEEERLLWNAVVECGVVVSVRGDYGFLRSASRPEDGGVLPRLALCFCLCGGWGGPVAGWTAVVAVGTVRRIRSNTMSHITFKMCQFVLAIHLRDYHYGFDLDIVIVWSCYGRGATHKNVTFLNGPKICSE